MKAILIGVLIALTSAKESADAALALAATLGKAASTKPAELAPAAPTAEAPEVAAAEPAAAEANN